MIEPVIGIIGGSGVYAIDGLEGAEWREIASPWGAPSDALLFGRVGSVACVFLPRHGRGHKLSPTHLNYRANIDVLKRAGCTELLSLSAVGSLREDMRPGDFVLVDQFIDRSFARAKSFFGEGCVAHVSMADPVCGRLGKVMDQAAQSLDITWHGRGTYLVMEGPQFSTRAESALYRSWGCSVIGMTNMPEAKLAREAELCYASIAMVTDYDCWHPAHDAVSVDQVVQVMQANTANAVRLLRAALPGLGHARPPCPAGCDHALEHAILTAPTQRSAELIAKLDAVGGRVLARSGVMPERRNPDRA
ncbi:MAG: S-methyl-5'-thioadenosine phosphorylase [Acidocella sp.]|nr:S-methyl-5'-thioadenosine phosphorylase [Acidocella sp.]